MRESSALLSDADSTHPNPTPLCSSTAFCPVELDKLLYEFDGGTAVCRGASFRHWAFPRHFVSVRGLIIGVSRVQSLAAMTCIPSSVETVGSTCQHAFVVAAEFGSRISCFEDYTFHSSFSLMSVSIPSSVQKLCVQCFYQCFSLSLVAFEPSSKLSMVGDVASSHCLSLESISGPAAPAIFGNQTF
jgi:hypothetical protein